MTQNSSAESTPAKLEREINIGPDGDIRFYLKGAEGAVQFTMLAGWHRKPTLSDISYYPYPMATDLGYHARKPHYDDQDVCFKDCPIIGGPCYYDGSSLNAEAPMRLLINKGSDALWEYLEGYYYEVFSED